MPVAWNQKRWVLTGKSPGNHTQAYHTACEISDRGKSMKMERMRCVGLVTKLLGLKGQGDIPISIRRRIEDRLGQHNERFSNGGLYAKWEPWNHLSKPLNCFGLTDSEAQSNCRHYHFGTEYQIGNRASLSWLSYHIRKSTNHRTPFWVTQNRGRRRCE